MRRVRQQFLRARETYGGHAAVYETIGDRLQARLVASHQAQACA